MKITGNAILITGGGSGIGRGLAEVFHALGNQVIISGRRKQALDETTKKSAGMKSLTLDIEDPANIRAFVDEVAAQYPALNVLINNAGIMRFENLQKQQDDLADAESIVATNLLRSNPSHRGAAASAAEAAILHHHERLVRAGICPDGSHPDVLRDQGGPPLLYAIAALSAARLDDGGSRINSSVRRDRSSEWSRGSSRNAASSVH